MSTEDRKTRIADAAIAVLAELGARGLTHRAVDARAALPEGSTSFYCRSRTDLLALAFHRHAALDLADLAQDARDWQHHTPTLEGVADSLVARIQAWLAPGMRDRLVARFELFLIASRTPDLAAIVEQQREKFMEMTVNTLALTGSPCPHEVAPALMMMVDAILFGQVAHQARPFDAPRCRAMLTHLMRMGGTTQAG